MLTLRRTLFWAFGLLALFALAMLSAGPGTAPSAAAPAPLTQYAGDSNGGLPAVTTTPTVEPEYAILQRVKENNPTMNCVGPLGTPGHRRLEQCIGSPGHVANAFVDGYNSPTEAQAAWQNRRDSICPTFPLCTDSPYRGYQGYEAGNTNYPYAHHENYLRGNIWVIGAESTDDTHFVISPFVAHEIIDAAIELGYLGQGTPTIIPSNTPTVTATCPPSWQQVPSPNASSADNYLLGVSALSPTDVWAVGYYSNTVTQRYETLTEHWNGSVWTIVPSPNPAGWHNYLRAVDGVASNDVWAVGDGLPYVGYGGGYLLTFHWDGTSWTVVPNPNPGYNYANGLSGVVALASNDVWATGFWRAYSFRGLLMHWDGLEWVHELDPFYHSGGLSGISGVSSTDLWAVGLELSDSSLVYHRDSSGWSYISSPDIRGIRGVSALASNDVWAVGEGGIIRWNGTSWLTMTVPVGGLLSVDALAANDVWAVASTAVLHWNGSQWNVRPLAAGESLVNVDAYAQEDVWAVGSSLQDGVKRTLVERYTGGSCNTTPTPVVTATATPTVWPTATTGAVYDLTGTAYWTSVCPAPVLRLTTHFTTSASVTAGNSVMRITNSIGQTHDVPVPPLPPNTSYSYDCMMGDCVPSDWVTHIPITLTVDVFNQVSESNENNNTFVQQYPPPMPTPCAITPTSTPTGTPVCTLQFTDVPLDNTFYPFVRCLACRGIVQGYPCGGAGEPCDPGNDPYFRPNNPVTRGQIAKIVAVSAGFADPVPPTQQTFEDVAYGSTFWEYIERLAVRGIVGGYPCGGPNEPCIPPNNRLYFRPNNGATRGQMAKIDSEAAGFDDTIPETQYTFADVPYGHTFWLYVERLLLNRPGVMSGYPCGGPNEPCDSENRPYFRPNNGVTRGQTSKIAANAFFPGCNPP